MAQLFDEEIQKIIAQHMPGFTVAEQPVETAVGAEPHPKAETSTPELDVLRRKYGEQKAHPMLRAERDEAGLDEDAGAQGEPRPGNAPAEAKLVVVKPASEGDASAIGPGPKVVVVSRKAGDGTDGQSVELTGAQG